MIKFKFAEFVEDLHRSSPVPNAALNLAANVRVPPCFAPVGSASDALMGKVGYNTSIGQIWAEIFELESLALPKKVVLVGGFLQAFLLESL